MSLPEQELVDYDVTSGNQECSGGYIYKAFEFIKKTSLTTKTEYPYKRTESACNKQKAKYQSVSISGYEKVLVNNEKS